MKESQELINRRLGEFPVVLHQGERCIQVRADQVVPRLPIRPRRYLNAEWPHEDVQEEDHEVDGG